MTRTQSSHTDKSIVRPFEILFFFLFYFKTTVVMKIALVRREVQKMIQVKNRNPLLSYNASVLTTEIDLFSTHLFK